MSGTANAVFRPDFTDYTTPQNRLAPQPTWADAATYNAQAVGDYIAQQRAKSEQMGLWDPNTGLPTGAGVVNAAQQTAQGILMGTTAPGIRAFHGSPYDFERFDTSKIGTGEGAQAYGHGLYMAGAEDVARSYRDALSDRQLYVDGKKVAEGGLGTDPTVNPEAHAALALSLNPGNAAGAREYVQRSMAQAAQGNFGYSKAGGNAVLKALDDMAGKTVEMRPGGHMYEVNIGADPEQLLHWDQTVGQHPPTVRDKLLDMGYGDADRGADVYSHMARGKEGDVGATQRLQQAGIPGIRYLDQGSRGAGEGTHNYVVFDANTIDILRKYGLAGLGIGLSGAAAGTQQQSQ